MSKYIQFEKKFGWSELAGIVSVVISIWAIVQSCNAREDARKIARLDLAPNLRMETHFIQDDSSPSYVVIENSGPVAAVQFEFQISILNLLPTGSESRGAITGAEHPKRLNKINAMDVISFNLPVPSTGWLIRNLQLKTELEWHKLLEVVISYKRESDLKEYASRAFYLLNNEGRLVSEYDNSLSEDKYGDILKAAYRSSPSKLTGLIHINELKPIEDLNDPKKW